MLGGRSAFGRFPAPNSKPYESKLDVTDQGTSLAWRTVLKAFRQV
jgi:hypothetical protein